MSPIHFPSGPFRKNPEFYEMSCPKCGWKEMLELDPCEMIVIPAPGKTGPSGPRQVTELPKTCLLCGTRLNKKKLPIKVWN